MGGGCAVCRELERQQAPRGTHRRTLSPGCSTSRPELHRCRDAVRRVGIPTTILTPNVSLSDPLPWEHFQQAASGV